MGSHRVTCYPTHVNAPCLNPSQTGRYLIYLPQRDRRLSWPSGEHSQYPHLSPFCTSVSRNICVANLLVFVFWLFLSLILTWTATDISHTVGWVPGNRKGIRPVKSTVITVLLAHYDSMVAACCFYTTVAEGCQLSHHRAPDPSRQHAVPVSNTIILHCFNAVGTETGKASGLSEQGYSNSQEFTLRTGLT